MEAFPFHLEIPYCLGNVWPSLCCPLMLYYADLINPSHFPGQIWNYQGGKWAKCKGHSELLLSWSFLFLPQEHEHCELNYQQVFLKHSWMLRCKWLWLINPSAVWQTVTGFLPLFCHAEWIVWSGLIFLVCEIEISHILLH